MNLTARGATWFALYVLLVAAPLAVALLGVPLAGPRPAGVAFAVALGLLAFPLVLAQFALVSRLPGASRPFGTDALLQFHRDMGLLALAFVLAHAALLGVAGLPWSAWSPLAADPVARSGAIALWAIVALVATTLLRRRLRLPYERWRGLHLALAVVAAAAMLAHVLAADGYARATALRLLLVAYAALFGLLLASYRLARPLRLRGRPWEVVENREVGAGTRLLRVRPLGHAGFAFEPGQFAWLVTGRSPLSTQQHPLSIASSAERPADGAIEFAVRALGDWSAGVVPALGAGTRVWVDGAFGAFTPERRAAEGFVLIAGGIGIAPMRAILLTMRDRGDRRPVVLVYAAPDAAHQPFREELERLRGRLALRVVDVLEHPPDDWTGERGRVTAALLERHLPPQHRRHRYLVCGPTPMMDAVEAALRAAGVPRAAIDSERFDVV